MDRPHGIGLGQRQQVVVALQVAWVVPEPVAAVPRLVEPVRLEHGAHRAIEHEDPLGKQTIEAGAPGRARERAKSGGVHGFGGTGRR